MDTSQTDESHAINNWIIRKHFKEMTECFLRAFEPYTRVNYAVRGTGDIQQIKYNLTRPFVEKEFLSQNEVGREFSRIYMGGEKDRCFKIYKRFINTTLFRRWLNDKKREISERELASLKRDL